jgi:O-antigen/teichoic acid export membrane protein
MVGFKFYEQIIAYTFKAFEHFAIAAYINSGSKLAILGINLILVSMGFGLLALFITIILGSALGIIAGIYLIRRYVADFRPVFKLKKDLIRKEINFAVWPWFQSLVIIVTFQIDRYVVVTYLGLAALTYYGLAATMFNHIHMGFNSIAPWLAPKITKMKSRDLDTSELYHTARNLSLLIGLSALLIFGFAYTPILNLILGHEKFLKTDSYMRLFTVFELFFVYSIIPNYFLNASGNERLYFKLVLFYCVAILVGMSLGYYISRNAEGLLVGMSVSTALSMFVQDVVINRAVHGNFKIGDSLLLFLPAVFIAICLSTGIYFLRLAMIPVSVLALYFVFFKYHRINFRLIQLD